MTLPNTGNKLKVAPWAAGTPEQSLLHICTAMHVRKQISLDTSEANAMMVLEAVYYEFEAVKTEYAKLAKKHEK